MKSLKALFVHGVAADKESMEASAREWVGNKKGWMDMDDETLVGRGLLMGQKEGHRAFVTEHCLRRRP